MAGPDRPRVSRGSSSKHTRIARTSSIGTENTSFEATTYECYRDLLLAYLSLRCWQRIAAVHIFLIVGDGAFFFFLLIGLHMMCDDPAPTDCEPRNWWYNWSVQALNVLFTYGALVTLPPRVANAVHLSQRRRSSQPGRDFYGQPTERIWFHIPTGHRRCITAILLVNNVTQYANQATRIVYYSYELQDTFPGNIWTNVFFFSSMLAAGIGAGYQFKQEKRLRKQHPGRFADPVGEGIEAAKQWLRVCLTCSRTVKTRPTLTSLDVEEVAGVVEVGTGRSEEGGVVHPAATAAAGAATCSRTGKMRPSRTSLDVEEVAGVVEVGPGRAEEGGVMHPVGAAAPAPLQSPSRSGQVVTGAELASVTVVAVDENRHSSNKADALGTTPRPAGGATLVGDGSLEEMGSATRTAPVPHVRRNGHGGTQSAESAEEASQSGSDFVECSIPGSQGCFSLRI